MTKKKKKTGASPSLFYRLDLNLVQKYNGSWCLPRTITVHMLHCTEARTVSREQREDE